MHGKKKKIEDSVIEFSGQNLDLLVDQLRANSVLELNILQSSSNDLQPILNFISQNFQCETLKLNQVVLTLENVAFITKIIQKNILKKFHLDLNDSNRATMSLLCEALGERNSIEELTICCNQHEILDDFLLNLRSNTTLTTLRIERSKLVDLSALLELVSSNRTIKKLSLIDCHLDRLTDYDKFFLFLKNNNLTELNLSTNFLANNKLLFSAICSGISLSKSLISIGLGYNQLTNEQGKQFCDACVSTSIEEINLECNNFGSNPQFLIDLINTKPGLKKLNLSENYFKREFIINFFLSLRQHKNLTHLFLKNCSLDDETFKCLLKVLKDNEIITHLNLFQNQITSCNELFSVVTSKKNIKYVNLNRNPIDNKLRMNLYKNIKEIGQTKQALTRVLNLSRIFRASNLPSDIAKKILVESLEDKKNLSFVAPIFNYASDKSTIGKSRSEFFRAIGFATTGLSEEMDDDCPEDTKHHGKLIR